MHAHSIMELVESTRTDIQSLVLRRSERTPGYEARMYTTHVYAMGENGLTNRTPPFNNTGCTSYCISRRYAIPVHIHPVLGKGLDWIGQDKGHPFSSYQGSWLHGGCCVYYFTDLNHHLISGSPTSSQISQWLQLILHVLWLLISAMSSHFRYPSVYIIYRGEVIAIFSKWLQHILSLENLC